MHIFYIKSLLSLIMLLMALVGGITAFEILGRSEKRFDIETLKKVHRANGILFLLLYVVIAFFCIEFLVRSKAEPSVRAVVHAVFALSVVMIVVGKILFTTVYKQLYSKLQTMGFILLLMTGGMIGTSGGYYLLTAKSGAEVPGPLPEALKKEAAHEQSKISVRTDEKSIAKGKELYESKCNACHDPASNDKVVGPGHKNLLKNPFLPVSKKPAVPENVINQLRTPNKDMPSFSYLSDEEVNDILAYLNTL